jgi:hypothetical protein
LGTRPVVRSPKPASSGRPARSPAPSLRSQQNHQPRNDPD